MSRYHGNDQKCPSCGITYREMRTGLDWREVFLSLRSPDPNPSTWRRGISRHTVLGRWHERKLELWRYHVETCVPF